jgi:hypothetical protein
MLLPSTSVWAPPLIHCQADLVLGESGDSLGRLIAFSDTKIAKCINDATDAQAVCNGLVALALEAVGKDNVTAVLARVTHRNRCRMEKRGNLRRVSLI